MAVDLTPEYAQSLGRIGGQLLAEDLLFQGQDVQFDTDLMYLDVANKRIGINNFGTSPAELYLGGDKRLDSVNLIVDGITSTDFGWVISTNNIQRPGTGTIYITPQQATNPIIGSNGVGVDKVNIVDRLIYAKNLNDNINLNPSGTGIVNITGNLQVNGTSGLIYVTGNVLVDGNYIAGSVINFGDNPNDTVSFTAEQTASLIPKTNNTYTLGDSVEKWGNVYSQQLIGTSMTNSAGILGGIALRGSIISSANPAQDILIDAPGTGDIVFNGLVPISGSNINNNTFNTYNAPYYLISTADGYINFAGTNAVVMPAGTSDQRITEILGTTRFNTESQFLEIYNGSEWQNVNGNIPLATPEYMSDESVIYDLMLG